MSCASCLTSLLEVADKATWHLFPVSLLLKSPFDSGRALANYPGVVNLVVATGMRSSAPTRVGTYTLHQRLNPARVRYLDIESGHNGWSGALTADDWQRLLALEPASK